MPVRRKSTKKIRGPVTPDMLEPERDYSEEFPTSAEPPPFDVTAIQPRPIDIHRIGRILRGTEPLPTRVMQGGRVEPVHDWSEGGNYTVVDFDEARQRIVDQLQGSPAAADMMNVTVILTQEMRAMARNRPVHLIIHHQRPGTTRAIPQGISYAAAKITCVFPDRSTIVEKDRDNNVGI